MIHIINIVIFFILGSIITFFWINQLRFTIKQIMWKKTTGKVIESGIVNTKPKRAFTHAIGGLKKVKAKYVYTVKGKEYKDIVPINFKTNFKPLLEKQLEKYTEGNEISVYYDPDAPFDNKTKKPGLTPGSIFGYLFFLAVICFLYLSSLYSFLFIINKLK